MIRNTNQIARTLLDVREGAKLKVRTDEGYYVTAEVSEIDDDIVGHDREIAIGDPDGPHLLVYVEGAGESINDLSNYNVFAVGPDNEDRGEVSELRDLRSV